MTERAGCRVYVMSCCRVIASRYLPLLRVQEYVQEPYGCCGRAAVDGCAVVRAGAAVGVRACEPLWDGVRVTHYDQACVSPCSHGHAPQTHHPLTPIPTPHSLPYVVGPTISFRMPPAHARAHRVNILSFERATRAARLVFALFLTCRDVLCGTTASTGI